MSAKRRLKEARRIRHRIAQDFEALETGQLTLIEILTVPTNALSRVSIYDVLRRAPKLGNEGSKKICMKSKIWPETKLGNLTSEERQAVLEHLPPRAKNLR